MKVTLFQLRDFVSAKLVSNGQFESYPKATLAIHCAYRNKGYPLEPTTKLTSTKEEITVWVYDFNLVKQVIESMTKTNVEKVEKAEVTPKSIQKQIIEMIKKHTVRTLTQLSNAIKVTRVRLLSNIGVLVKAGKIQKLNSGLYCMAGIVNIKAGIAGMLKMIDTVINNINTTTKTVLQIARESICSLYGSKHYTFATEMQLNHITRQLMMS